MDFIRSQTEHPHHSWRQDEMWWDFWSLSPESIVVDGRSRCAHGMAAHQRLWESYLQPD